MPQMKPMNWLILFISMNLIILLLNIKNFFKLNLKLNHKKFKKMNKMKNNWMW